VIKVPPDDEVVPEASSYNLIVIEVAPAFGVTWNEQYEASPTTVLAVFSESHPVVPPSSDVVVIVPPETVATEFPVPAEKNSPSVPVDTTAAVSLVEEMSPLPDRTPVLVLLALVPDTVADVLELAPR